MWCSRAQRFYYLTEDLRPTAPEEREAMRAERDGRHIQDDWPVKGFYVGSQFVETVVVPPQEQRAYTYEEGLSDFEDELMAAHAWADMEDEDDDDDFFINVDGLGQPIDDDDDVDGLGQPDINDPVEAAGGQESHHNANDAVQPEHAHEPHREAVDDEEKDPSRPFDPKPYSLNAEEYPGQVPCRPRQTTASTLQAHPGNRSDSFPEAQRYISHEQDVNPCRDV